MTMGKETAPCGRVGGGYVRLYSAMVGAVCHWEMQLRFARSFIMVGSRWRWVAGCGLVAPRRLEMQVQVARRLIITVGSSRWHRVLLGNAIADS